MPLGALTLSRISISAYEPSEGVTSTPGAQAVFLDGEVSHPLTAIWYTNREDDTTGFAEVDLNDRESYEYGYKAPWVIEFQRVTRGLSDRMGQIEHLAFGAVFSDTMRYWRGVLDDEDNRYLTNCPAWVKMIDDESRRVEGLWRLIATGYIADYAPVANLRFRLTCCDWMKANFGRKRRGQESWQPRILSGDGGDFPDSPMSVQGVAAQIIYGLVSDQGEGDILDTPTGLVGSVSGAGGAIARRYAVTALRGANARADDHNGETDPMFVDVAACPDDQEFGPSNYVALSWDAVTNANAYRVYGRILGGLKLIKTVTDTSFNDGIGGLIELRSESNPPTANNTLTGDTGYGSVPVLNVGTDLTIGSVPMKMGLVACHACKAIDGVYLDGVRVPDSRFNDAEFLAPGFPNSPGDYTTINDTRYTIIYVASQIIDADEFDRLTVNVRGIEDVGDGSGDLIESIPLQCQHFVKNFLAPSERPTEDWLTDAPEFESIAGLTLLDEDSFDDVHDETLNRLADGYQGGCVIGAGGRFHSALDVLADFNMSGDFEGYFNRRGQYAIAMEADSPTLGEDVTDVINIVDGTFEIVDEVNTGFYNVHPYAYDEDYTGRREGIWVTGLEQDDNSIANYDQEREVPQRWEFAMLRTANSEQQLTLEDVIARKVARYANPRRKVTLAVSFSGLSLECGDVIPVTHIEGIGASGWSEQSVRIHRHDVDPTHGRVLLEGYAA
jgi:hypothetical protein